MKYILILLNIGTKCTFIKNNDELSDRLTSQIENARFCENNQDCIHYQHDQLRTDL